MTLHWSDIHSGDTFIHKDTGKTVQAIGLVMGDRVPLIVIKTPQGDRRKVTAHYLFTHFERGDA